MTDLGLLAEILLGVALFIVSREIFAAIVEHRYARRRRKRPATTGPDALIGRPARVFDGGWSDDGARWRGRITVDGVVWRAFADRTPYGLTAARERAADAAAADDDLSAGSRVRIVGRDGLRLEIEPEARRD